MFSFNIMRKNEYLRLLSTGIRCKDASQIPDYLVTFAYLHSLSTSDLTHYSSFHTLKIESNRIVNAQ